MQSEPPGYRGSAAERGITVSYNRVMNDTDHFRERLLNSQRAVVFTGDKRRSQTRVQI